MCVSILDASIRLLKSSAAGTKIKRQIFELSLAACAFCPPKRSSMPSVV